MALSGPVISVDDDEDDQFLIRQILEELHLPNPVRLFSNGSEVLDYLLTTREKPLLILCDINMPVMNGMELRYKIESNVYLKKKSIPFIFLSTAGTKEVIDEAYQCNIQGFYKKENDYEDLKKQVDLVIRYWQKCLHPNG